MVVRSQSDTFRKRALICERRAKETIDPAFKREWQELAMEWHAIASISAQEPPDLEE